MIYIERQPSRQSVLLLALLSLALYLGALMLPELSAGDEAVNAAVARDMVETGHFLKTSLYGQSVKYFPLYSWLVTLCSGFQAPTIFTLRLPAVLALGGLAVLAGMAAWHLQSMFAGWIAAAVVLTSFVSFRIGAHAQAEILQAFFLFAAWYAWFRLGHEQKRWAWAWGTVHALLLLAVMAVGSGALFWFYFPMFFMQRPLNAKMRMQVPAHLVSVFVLALVMAVWLFITPDQPFMPWGVERVLSPSRESSNYLWHFLFFPWRGILSLGAWSLLVWAPFCIALRQFEDNPAGCLMFRTIVFSISVLIWLCPGTTTTQLLPVFAPLAVLIGVHFEIVIRRYQDVLNKILRVVAWGVCIFGIPIALFWLFMATGLVAMTCQMQPSRMTLASGFICALVVITVSLIWYLVLHGKEIVTFRCCIIWCIFGVRILALCSVHAWHIWNHSDRRLAGEALAGTLKTTAEVAELEGIPQADADAKTLQDMKGEADVIYYLPNRDFNYLCLVETFYLDRHIVQINNLATDLPDTPSAVYVLSSRVPALATRSWEPVSPVVDMKLRRRPKMTWTTSKRPWLTVSRVPSAGEKHIPRPLLIYRGVLKQSP